MPRRKQDKPKHMKWDSEESDGSQDSEMESTDSSPRHRRESGYITSADGLGSPATSPLHDGHTSPVLDDSDRLSPMHITDTDSFLQTDRSYVPQALQQMMSSKALLMSLGGESELPDFGLPHTSPFLPSSIPFGLTGLPVQRGETPLDLSVPRKKNELNDIYEGNLMQKNLGALGFLLPPHVAQLALLAAQMKTGISTMPSQHNSLESDILNFKNSPANNETNESSAKLTSFPPDLLKHLNQIRNNENDLSSKWPSTPLYGFKPMQMEGNTAFARMSEIGQAYENRSIDANSSKSKHTAWQNHWHNRGQDATKEVLKCVWCKISFSSLDELTAHMKEAKNCGVNLGLPVSQIHQNMPLPPQYNPQKFSIHNLVRPPSHSGSSSGGSIISIDHMSNKDQLLSPVKENLPLPRKLVRGQDVWLGKGAEQTRQILKCMWCGQSFKSLKDMTTHMQQTQHYTNIISQEQIISWKTSEEKSNDQHPVNSVLTCKVCDLSFSSLKELSNHMVKNAHYKEHIMRSMSESSTRRRPNREKRKKSLPVRKLLELERAQYDNNNSHNDTLYNKKNDLSCEKCGNIIAGPLFIDHIRNCVGSADNFKSGLFNNDHDTGSSLSDQRGNNFEKSCSTEKDHNITEQNEVPSVLNALEKLIEKNFDSGRNNQNQGGQLGPSMLQRLGVDESVDYSKPIMDSQLIGMYSAFSHLHNKLPPGSNIPPNFNLPPTLKSTTGGSNQRVFDNAISPSFDPENSDIIKESPSHNGSRPSSSASRDDYGSDSSRKSSPKHTFQPILVQNNEHKSKNMFSRNVIFNDEKDSSDSEMKDSYESLQSMKPNHLDRSVMKMKTSNLSNVNIRVRNEFKGNDNGDPENENMEIDNNCQKLPFAKVQSFSNNNQSYMCQSSSTLKGPGNPLAALQNLCDKTESDTDKTSSNSQANVAQTTMSLNGHLQANSDSILAFSWACNDAVVTTDSVMKCAFCDTTFVTKGAYRHHLSKMHFVKDGVLTDTSGSEKSSNKTNKSQQKQNGRCNGKMSHVTPNEETPHSKFLKYTELAKQLSSV
ncbi:unnamed protein product [Meganyctiphanes norvegica]|uniref:C2H2-type domain-containing protein n=1 Tax=Meganyctiphanes norvegica TaxID=48144 RepID=A0AAV2QVA3_MEGNR